MAPSRELRPKPLFDEPSMRQFLFNHGVKEVHMGKIWKHMLANPDCPLDQIPQCPERIRSALKEEFVYCTSTVVKTTMSNLDGTIKMLIRLQDGGEVEAVLIHHAGEALDPEQRQADRCGARDTLCISSQVGCKLGCTFCATGTMGLQGNLWAGEIQEQLIHARSLRQVSNVVFMGMGEPLENFDSVSSAIRGLVDPQRFGLAPSSVTVSTVGIIPNMRRLMQELPKIKMALSLHAPSQELREQIVPMAKRFKMPQLMEVLDDYAAITTSDGKRKGMIMVSYCMIENVNDSDDHARQLRDLVGQRPVIVNLIPYNKFEGNVHDYNEPSPERVDAFLKVLSEGGVRVFERRHHGRDIGAACGQLAKLSIEKPAADIENCSCLLAKERIRVHEDTLRPAVDRRVRRALLRLPGQKSEGSDSSKKLLLLAGAAVAAGALACFLRARHARASAR
eukprot:TRINITY_DN7880_c0_g1_i1.p1 TRINITY_DN7880_c0_g1~~TRINITY_DN7880_c0_g1_i1.p1  ORF type:complete len:484 (-),score=110.12 TRINITY_DN7880_c0_g1_i1:356-1705(-)